VNIAGRTLVTYNLHLESRGDDALRRLQLDEVLDDTHRYGSEMPILVAGDMNLELSQGDAAQKIRGAQFRDTFGEQVRATTPPRSILHRGQAIDWVLARGPLHATRAQVHGSVSASDHYPLSLTLAFE
jgi:endonuclease/exonuclease/phosphatase family metal-dependent hydrolase